MENGGLADLDELVLRCRDHRARTYVRESVACYKSGAYKASIISSWIAVLYDLVGKFTELSLTGDQRARQIIDEFDRHVEARNLPWMQNFERTILTTAASDFELLSPVELEDLERLYLDRNRCAHLSMRTAEEIYEPVAELARYHLHNAVAHVLSQPPAQGKAALNHIWQMISSELFPIRKENARAQLENSPLARARPALVRNVVASISANIVMEYREERHRQIAALQAVLDMYRGTAEPALTEKLRSLTTRPDFARYPQLIWLCSRLRFAWDSLLPTEKEKCVRFVTGCDTEAAIELLDVVTTLPDLSRAMRERVNSFSEEEIENYFTNEILPNKLMVERGVSLFRESNSFSQAKERFTHFVEQGMYLLDLRPLKRLLTGMTANRQIYDSLWVFGQFEAVLKVCSAKEKKELEREWRRVIEKVQLSHPNNPRAERLVATIESALASDNAETGMDDVPF